MNKKTANLFVKITAKNPATFIGVVLLGTFILLFLTISTKINVVRTYEASFDGQKIRIKNELIKMPKIIYVYSDKNESVYSVNVNGNVEYDSNSTIVNIEDLEINPDLEHIKVDIPVDETSLFSRVFLRGGRS